MVSVCGSTTDAVAIADDCCFWEEQKFPVAVSSVSVFGAGGCGRAERAAGHPVLASNRTLTALFERARATQAEEFRTLLLKCQLRQQQDEFNALLHGVAANQLSQLAHLQEHDAQRRHQDAEEAELRHQREMRQLFKQWAERLETQQREQVRQQVSGVARQAQRQFKQLQEMYLSGQEQVHQQLDEMYTFQQLQALWQQQQVAQLQAQVAQLQRVSAATSRACRRQSRAVSLSISCSAGHVTDQECLLRKLRLSLLLDEPQTAQADARRNSTEPTSRAKRVRRGPPVRDEDPDDGYLGDDEESVCSLESRSGSGSLWDERRELVLEVRRLEQGVRPLPPWFSTSPSHTYTPLRCFQCNRPGHVAFHCSNSNSNDP